MNIITRFAPSPTGFLHVGNIRTALVNWLYTKAMGGQFILRIDDTDQARSETHYVDAIQNDLTWLGLTWDAIFYQSKRLELYEDAKQKLIASGRLYPCYETQEELAVKKKIQLSRNLPPIYDRAALQLSNVQRIQLEANGIQPHWRFLIDGNDIKWQDGIKGDMRFMPANLSDPVLIRADGTMTYTLASVVDDIDLEITDIIRGEDHVTNSAVHIQIFEALGARAPNFAHLSLLASKEQEISKRIGGFDIGTLRAQGIEPMAINSFLSKIGTSDPIQAYMTLKELLATFDITKFGRSPANYDQNELEHVNTKLLHHMPYEIAKQRFAVANIADVGHQFWDMAKSNISKLDDIKLWWRICNTILDPIDIDYAFTSAAGALLPNEPWDVNTWNVWMEAVKKATGKSGKDLFMPIRMALTGLQHGPELKVLLPMIGYEKVLTRLNGKPA